jgi:site-specific DNA-methyltransferase (adenine-specific)
MDIMQLNQIYVEDCLETLSRMPDNFIQATITSPPYDDLRTYNGYSFDFESIAKGLYRVTKPGGVVVWVVGDATKNGSETGTSFRQALFFMQLGFRLHDTMIYQKHNFSNPSNNRYHQIFEYMFVFSKGAPKTFQPILDRPNVYAGVIGSWGKNTSRQKDGTFVERPKKTNRDFGMRYNIWRIKTESKPLHPAAFPEQLAKDHIQSWTKPGDVVYDPFLGSGTTAKVASTLARNFIGSEISQEYADIANARITGLL